MNREQTQSEPAVADVAEKTRAGLTTGDEQLIDGALRTARFVLRELNQPLDAAEDLRQVGLLKYFEIDRATRSQIQNKKAYLYRIMRNNMLNQIRKEKNVVLESLESLESKSVESQMIVTTGAVETAALLDEVWSEIETDDRRLFELLSFGYTGREVAFQLDISNEAARKRVSRLKAKIREILVEKPLRR
jgi:RNA polymerase sigma factor (sigma-70 family)